MGIVYPCEAEFLAVYKTTHFIKNFTNTMLLARISNLCSTTSNWGMPSKISIPTGFKGDYEAGLVQCQEGYNSPQGARTRETKAKRRKELQARAPSCLSGCQAYKAAVL